MAVVQQQPLIISPNHTNGDEGLFRAVYGGGTPKVSSCRIILQKFDNYGRVTEYPSPTVSYYPGEPIYGYLDIELGKPTKARAIRIKFMGYERVHWTTGSGKHRRHHIKVVVYYNSRQTIWTPPKEAEQTLPAGKYRFYWVPFVLPFPVGPTYVGARGIIHHFIHANIDIPMATDIRTQINLTVVPTAFIPETVRIPQNYFRREKKFLGSSDPMIIETCLLNSVTLPGGSITFFVRVDNQNKDKKIKELRVSLTQIQQFRTNHNQLTLHFPICYREIHGENGKAFLEPKSKFEANMAIQVPMETHYTNFFTYTMSNRCILTLEFVTSGISTNVTAVLGEVVILPLFAIPPPPFYITNGLKEWHGELTDVYPHVSWLELRQRQMDYEKAKFFIPQVTAYQFKVGGGDVMSETDDGVDPNKMENGDTTEYYQHPIQSWNPVIQHETDAVLLESKPTSAVAFKDLTTNKDSLSMQNAPASNAMPDGEEAQPMIPLINNNNAVISQPIQTMESPKQEVVIGPQVRTIYTDLGKKLFLNLKIVDAKDLENHEIIGKSDPYVKVILLDQNKLPYLRKVKTKTIKSNLNPVWNEDFMLYVMNPTQDFLSLEVMDKDVVSDDKMGNAVIALGAFPITAKSTQVIKLEKAKHGTLNVELSWVYA